MVGMNRLVMNPLSEGLGDGPEFAQGRGPEPNTGAGWR